ncbi:hypothetical protein [Spirosoma fluviale]|uniref:Uncharacterized protein n=1 Tax=Spirosoma fluviale TaxID=1597977 RepID=A0A286GU97_9BACT|nr:hypothetical protein [Spirosoma fluviale]SOD99125.1 hypothetical protein SAMN06269250_6285 [Spirosoma fluviale]
MSASTPKRRFSLDTYLSLLALVSSFCAIGITFYQAYLQRVQQYASVTPILNIYHTNHIDDNISGSAMSLVNVGLGPAFIDSVQYYYQHKRYATMSGVLKASLSPLPGVESANLSTSDLWIGKVIPANEKQNLYQTSHRGVARHLDQHYDLIRCVVYYHSIYGESWVFDPSMHKQARKLK